MTQNVDTLRPKSHATGPITVSTSSTRDTWTTRRSMSTTSRTQNRNEGAFVNNPTTINAAPGVPFIEIVREFDAPASAVFRAHTDPELFRQWIGPRGMQIDSLELDARTGGGWKYAFRGGGDMQFSFRGVFHTVEPDTLIIQTVEFNMAPAQVGLTTTVLAEVDGRTRLTSREIYPSVEARDAALASGMEHGVNEGYEKLDELLA